MHTHANAYWTDALYARNVLRLTEDDVVFSAAKLFFAYGLGNALTFPLSAGATTILMPERPTPQAVFRRLVDAAADGVLRRADALCSDARVAGPARARGDVALRLCVSAGEALPREIGERFTAHFGCEILDGIGSTEMLHIFLSNREGEVRYGTTGVAVPGYDVELRGDDGGPVADGEVGDLYIRGPSAALMYWTSHDKSRSTFQGEWTRSGDKYVRRDDGRYVYAGRADDMLKVSGLYVSPFEVEAALVQHPAVLEAAVIGKQDADGLTKTKAYVVLKPGHAPDACTRRRAEGVREGQACTLQIPALHRVHRRTAEDRHRQDPALPAARAREGERARLTGGCPQHVARYHAAMTRRVANERRTDALRLSTLRCVTVDSNNRRTLDEWPVGTRSSRRHASRRS